jgi:murein DD-endopeptidase MepM/ murein hydrolase activator NlpD
MVYAVDGTPRIPGRYAIDFVRIDARGRSKREGSERPLDFHGYGAPVLAVADGVIASTRDDMQEAATVSANRRHPQADATGNYVSLRLADGRVVFYEHLKPGSVAVKPGQRVKAGQVIGALGFTGDSTGPHLHFSVASQGAEGVAFTFDRFELLGRYPDLAAMDKTPWQALETGVVAQRRNEWPGWNTVLRFPAAGA